MTPSACGIPCGNPRAPRWVCRCPRIWRNLRPGDAGLAGDNLRRHVAEYIPGDPQKVLDKIWQLGDERFARGVPCKKGLKELLAALEDMGLAAHCGQLEARGI